MIDCVLVDMEHGGDLGSGETVPGGESEQLAISLAETVEGEVEAIDVVAEGSSVALTNRRR